jgi:hypothetical protein
MVDLATQLIQRKSGKYDPTDLEDRYETRLRALIDAKLAGGGLVTEAERPVERGTSSTSWRRSREASRRRRPQTNRRSRQRHPKRQTAVRRALSCRSRVGRAKRQSPRFKPSPRSNRCLVGRREKRRWLSLRRLRKPGIFDSLRGRVTVLLRDTVCRVTCARLEP